MPEKLRCVDPECGCEPRCVAINDDWWQIRCFCGCRGPYEETDAAALAAWKRVQERSNPEPVCAWTQNNTNATWNTGCGRTIQLNIVIGPCPYCKRRIRVANPGSGEGE